MNTIFDALWEQYGKYKIRQCRTMHECAVCEQTIAYGHLYFDGGYGRRAHVGCADPDNRADLDFGQAEIQ